MKKALCFVCVTFSALLSGAAAAQDILITNARIIDGTGKTIDAGSIAIRDGRIESVVADSLPVADARLAVDAAGMTVMPGFIDTHRHIVESVDNEAALEHWLDEQAPQRMREFLAAGFTTILSAGDPTAGIVELKRRLEDGRITGPRLLVSGSRIIPAPSEQVESCRRDPFCSSNRSLIASHDDARSAVAALAEAGVDAVKIRLDANDPTGVDQATAAVIASEAARHGMPSIAHATSVSTMLAAIDAGVTRLVHTPHTEPLLGTDAARIVHDAGVPMSSTLAVWVPTFGDENQLLWRDGSPLPTAGLDRVGQGQTNARLLWDAGVLYAFGTDTGFHPQASLLHELRALGLLFSAEDIVSMLTKNAAVWLELDEQIGTIEPGKSADVVVLDGDPFTDIRDLVNVRIVIKDGRLVHANLK